MPILFVGKSQNAVSLSKNLLKTGISENSLSRKLSGKRDFRLEEVKRICAILGIENPSPYFFT